MARVILLASLLAPVLAFAGDYETRLAKLASLNEAERAEAIQEFSKPNPTHETLVRLYEVSNQGLIPSKDGRAYVQAPQRSGWGGWGYCGVYDESRKIAAMGWKIVGGLQPSYSYYALSYEGWAPPVYGGGVDVPEDRKNDPLVWQRENGLLNNQLYLEFVKNSKASASQALTRLGDPAANFLFKELQTRAVSSLEEEQIIDKIVLLMEAKDLTAATYANARKLVDDFHIRRAQENLNLFRAQQEAERRRRQSDLYIQ